MDNDEREHRDVPSDDSERQPPPEPAEEFESASWPAQNAAAPPPPDESSEKPPDESATEPVAEAAPSEEAIPPAPADTAPTSPPPAEVEAYDAEPGTGEADASAAMAAHSVPATTEPGESTQCPRCGTHNRAGTAFCQNCGANLQAGPGVPPSERAATAAEVQASGHAFLGPIVLLVGAAGIAVAWLLPFALGTGSLYDRAFGDPTGYGVAFWSGYGDVSGLAQQAYFGFAAPAPILVLLLALLAIGGMLRAGAGRLQVIGLEVALLWAVGLLALFIVVEVAGGGGTDLPGVLRALSPAGIIFALASLIVLIGCITRFGRA